MTTFRSRTFDKYFTFSSSFLCQRCLVITNLEIPLKMSKVLLYLEGIILICINVTNFMLKCFEREREREKEQQNYRTIVVRSRITIKSSHFQ